MGCGSSKDKAAAAEQPAAEQPAASATLLEPATGKPADPFDLTNLDEIKASLAKLTADELSATMKALSPEVANKVQAALTVVAKQQEEKATAEAAAPAAAIEVAATPEPESLANAADTVVDDELAPAPDAELAPGPDAGWAPAPPGSFLQNSEETRVCGEVVVLDKPADKKSNSLFCCA